MKRDDEVEELDRIADGCEYVRGIKDLPAHIVGDDLELKDGSLKEILREVILDYWRSNNKFFNSMKMHSMSLKRMDLEELSKC